MTALDNEIKSESITLNEMPGVRLVFQRFRQASLLINEEQVVTVGDSVGVSTEETLLLGSASSLTESSPPSSTGILVYVSFSQTATPTKVQQAAKTVLNLPIATLGSWGDGAGTSSLMKLAATAAAAAQQKEETQPHSTISLLIVPQANLICKIKSAGKSIQYHEQCDKTMGQDLYRQFVDCITELLVEHQQVCRGLASSLKPRPKSTTPDPSIPPNQLFRDETVYATWDEETGFPLTTVVLGGGDNGEEPALLTKSAVKKLKKILESHTKRHIKYLEKPPPPAPPPTTPKQQEEPSTISLDPTFLHLVAGTFGKRQGLQLVSDMGPFCHVVEI
jgi:hypothetical protein